jgi:hypothetical protein
VDGKSKNIYIFQEKKETEMASNPNPYPFPRQPFLFDTSNIKCRSNREIIAMARQWNTFERIENYNDQIYNRFCQGIRDKHYYQYSNMSEKNDYNIGQMLHVNRYPFLTTDARVSTIGGVQVSTLASISDRTIPNVEIIAGPSHFSQVSKTCVPIPSILTSSEYMAQQSEDVVYLHVSTYNGSHKYKYNFESDEEKLMYLRAERRARLAGLM